MSLVLAAVFCASCADATRYRVLSFFFDGVPRPGEEPSVGYAVPPRRVFGDIGESQERVASAAITYVHAPFRDNDCGGCHNPTSGQLYRSSKEGLCAGCHTDVPGPERYVHGPVAVNECLFCHHPHGSAYPGMLVTESTDLCFRCHAREDLSRGEHHVTVDEQSCSACHSAHGGEDRFFLKRSDR